jgi:cytochrome P450
VGVGAVPVGRQFVGTPATAPGPLGPDMLRALRAIRADPLEYLASAWREYGDVVQFPIPRPPSYLVNDPDAVWQVLTNTGRTYGKSTIQYRSLALVTGEGLLAADTPAWREQRPLVQPAFHHATLERIVAHVVETGDRVASEWCRRASGLGVAGAVVDVDAAMMRAGLEVVGHALFGADLSADADRLTSATLAALDVVVARARVPITPPSWVPSPGNRRLQAAVRELDATVARMVDERRTAHCSGSEPADMLDLLLGARDDTGRALTVEQVRDQIVTFVVAGHETVATALSWAWALLAADPVRQALLQEESDAVLGGRAPTFADVARLPYARAVLDESMRLYPPAWLLTRKTLADGTIAGFEVPEGALLIMSPWLVHRHPDRWSRADAFEPDRFLDGSVDRTAFIPFGAGLRQCIGRDFAYVEGVLLLSMLAGRVEVSYPPGAYVPRAEPLVTMRPIGGVRLRVRARG